MYLKIVPFSDFHLHFIYFSFSLIYLFFILYDIFL